MKVSLVDLNQNPETKIPEWFKKECAVLFGDQLSIATKTNELRATLKECDYIFGWSFPKTFIKKNQNLKEVFLFSSQMPESFINQDFKLHSITGLNNKYVVSYIIKILEKLDREKNILILGNGTIGSLLDAKASLYKRKLITRNPKKDNHYTYEEYQSFIAEADIIIPTVTLNSETIKLFTKEKFFNHLKQDVTLINTARGELFNNDTLYDFFKKNPQAFYYTDVTVPEPYPLDGELRSLDNIAITNHIAGFGDGVWEHIWERFKPIAKAWT